MKTLITGAIWGVILAVTAARAQLQPEAHQEIPAVFGGARQTLSIVSSSAGALHYKSSMRTRISQLSSATAMPVEETPWRNSQMLPGQTILETADFEFPSVKAETRFLIQWIEGAGEVLGATEVRVFPTNLLSELKPLLGDGVLGIFDPQNELKQSLANNRVQFADLENTVLENFRGKLAVVGPFGSNKTNPITVEQIKTLAKNGVAVVWVLRPDDNSENPRPSFYSVPANQTASIVVQPELTANIGKNPRSQLNLIYFCKLALHPQPLTFPILKSQPE